MVVKKSTPNDGIYSELGRTPLLIIRQIQMIKFANRIWNLERKYLVKKALNVQIVDDINGHYKWVSDVIQIMNKNNIKEINVSKSDISHKLKDKFKGDLLERIKSYQEGKKLRTYAQFKHVIKFEPYLNMAKNIKHRIMFTKFRLSAHDLEIEKGRYNNKPIKAEERYCKFCKSNNNLIVEDEFHFLMICPLYQLNRDLMIKQVYEFFPNLTETNLKQQFVWLMSQENERCTIELSKFIAISMDLRSKELESYRIDNNNRTSHTTRKQK